MAEGSGFQVDYLSVQKHTHEQNKTHLIYYHTLIIQFTKTSSSYATLNIKFEIGYPLPASYPNPLKDNTFLVLYGVEGQVEHVPDVYDDQPLLTQPRKQRLPVRGTRKLLHFLNLMEQTIYALCFCLAI